MTKDRIVKFYARVGPRSACLLMTNCPLDGHLVFWQISVIISKTVQDTDILTMED